MAHLLRSRNRPGQPQQLVELDWGHPLATNLLWAFNGGIANQAIWKNLAAGGDAAASTVTRTVGAGFYGRHLAPASGTGSSLTLPTETTPTSVTRAILLNSFVGGGTRTVFCGGHQNGSLELNSTNQFGVWASAGIRATTAALTSGPMLLSASFQANNFRTYVNGIFQNSLTTINVAPATMAAIGGASATGSQGFSAALILGWQNRFLSDDEHERLFDEMWELFPSRRRRIIFLPSASTTNAQVNTTDASDVNAATGANWTTTQIAVIDAADIDAINATVGSITSASITTTDTADTLAIVAANWTTTQLASIDGADLFNIGTTVTTGGLLSITDSPDIDSTSADVWTTGQISSLDSKDINLLVANAGGIRTITKINGFSIG